MGDATIRVSLDTEEAQNEVKALKEEISDIDEDRQDALKETQGRRGDRVEKARKFLGQDAGGLISRGKAALGVTAIAALARSLEVFFIPIITESIKDIVESLPDEVTVDLGDLGTFSISTGMRAVKEFTDEQLSILNDKIITVSSNVQAFFQAFGQTKSLAIAQALLGQAPNGDRLLDSFLFFQELGAARGALERRTAAKFKGEVIGIFLEGARQSLFGK